MFKPNRVIRFVKSAIDAAKNEVHILTLSIDN